MKNGEMITYVDDEQIFGQNETERQGLVVEQNFDMFSDRPDVPSSRALVADAETGRLVLVLKGIYLLSGFSRDECWTDTCED